VQSGILGVRKFVIPATLIEQTVSFLQQVGAEGFEGFILWSGNISGEETFYFRSSIIPEQHAMLTETGLLVTVEGRTLFEVNRAIHSRNEILAAQVHSHPTDAYHSETDDTYPLVTLLGALSVVVPHFARNAPGDIETWAWYRLSRRAKWESASRNTDIEVV
jgi:hypothetical protein